MFSDSRIKHLKKISEKGDYVLYWVHASSRCSYNPALEFSIEKSLELGIPLLIIFIIDENYKEANIRHYRFLLEGLEDFRRDLNERDLDLKIFRGDPAGVILKLQKRAAVIITDKNYVGPQNEWIGEISEKLECSLCMVETNISVPVREVTDKEEYSAATFRKKYWKKAHEYLDHECNNENIRCGNFFEKLEGEMEFGEIEDILDQLNIADGIGASKFKGGYKRAKEELNLFIEKKLENYPKYRNDPNIDCLSNMSPYLHFGQISPVEIAKVVAEKGTKNFESYLEELLIRRELAINFCFYNPNYDNFEGLHSWSKKTLNEHRNDEREYIYSFEDFENCRTHDIYWNAAQKEMIIIGKMHGYMRMYWGKKILEWSETPEKGIAAAIKLNNKYELDGRDPNGYAGVMWCFGKHDRAWSERNVFGKIRYMNSAGLKRKFDADGYVEKIMNLQENL